MNNWKITKEAAVLHQDAVVWDMTLPWREYGPEEKRLATLPRMHASGFNFVSLTLAADWNGVSQTIHKIAKERAYFLANSESYILAESVEDILRAKQEHKLAVGFHFQGTNPVNYDINLIEIYYKLGIRHMLMAYNSKNAVGDGWNERTDGGLSNFGIRLVKEMNRVGMLIDGTHTGYQTTMELFEVSTDPVIFSHANANAVSPNGRNIRDDQIVACAKSGGVIGIDGVGIFLGDNDVSAEALIRHIDHISQLVGPQHVGLGLDYVYDQASLTRGHNTRPAWNPGDDLFGNTPRDDVKYFEPENLPTLTEKLMVTGYSESEIRGILGENWLRVARAVWK